MCDSNFQRRSENAEFYNRRGHCYWKLGDIKNAILDFKESVLKDPSNKNHRIDLGEVLLQVDNNEIGNDGKI